MTDGDETDRLMARIDEFITGWGCDCAFKFTLFTYTSFDHI